MAQGLRISIKWKIFALVATMIAGAIFFIVLRTNSIFRQDKEAFVKELSAKLASSTAKNLSNRISTLQDKLIIFIFSRESLAHTGAKVDDQLQVLFSRYQEFNSIGFLSVDAAGSLNLDWIVRNPHGASVKWPNDYEKNFLHVLDTKKAMANGRGFWKAQSPTGEWLAVLGFSVQVVDNKAGAAGGANPPHKTAWIVGVMPSTAFDDLFNDFSTGLNTGYVVDDSGTAIAHSDNASRWKNLKTYPIVEEVVQSKKPGATGDFVDASGRALIGSFEQIYKMNLTAIVTTPRDKAFQAADSLAHSIISIGLVVLVIALGIAVLFSNYMTGPLQKLASIAEKIGAGDFRVPIDVSTNDEIGQLASSFQKMEKGLTDRDDALASAQGALVQSEKMGAFGQLSAGIAHEVKNPLAGILGHAQLAMGKIQNDDIRKHLEVIEKETRRCKTIVENLMKFARAEKAELTPTDLAQACQDTINLVDHQLSLAGCKIFKDFKTCPLVEANSNQLQQVLLNLMVNASHAMENCQTKHVIVRVLQAGDKAQIQIQDSGTGIPPEIQKKIFEPFFTTKPAGKGTGLGLSVSIGIVKEHKGEIYLKSEANKGTTFFIDIPIPVGAKMPVAPLENTHGGTQLGAEAGAAVPIKAPTLHLVDKPVNKAADKTADDSSVGHGDSARHAPPPAMSMAQKIADLKVEKKIESLPDVSLITHSKILQPGAKLEERSVTYTPTSQRTGLEYRTQGTPANPNENKTPHFKAEDFVIAKGAEAAPTPIEVADRFESSITMVDTKIHTPKIDALREEQANHDREKAAPIPQGEGSVLGGKAPLDEKTSITPELPEDVFEFNEVMMPTLASKSAPNSAAQGASHLPASTSSGPTHQSGAEVSLVQPQVTNTQMSSVPIAASVAAATKAATSNTPLVEPLNGFAEATSEFKVKIKRPKLKV